jgi:hypothetical protein
VITQKIIKHSPPPVVSYQPGTVWRQGQGFVPTFTQVQLTELIEKEKLKPGMFVTYYNLSPTDHHVDLPRLNFVLEVCTDVAELKFNHNRTPQPYRIMSLNQLVYNPHNLPYVRWDDISGAKQVSIETYDRLVNDHVQDYIKKHFPEHPAFIREKC